MAIKYFLKLCAYLLSDSHVTRCNFYLC